MSGISTHVLDISTGRPAAGVSVSLLRHTGTAWTTLTSAQTGTDGRAGRLLPDNERLTIGNYKLSFDIERYFEAMHVAALYPRIEIVFTVRDADANYHLPLLLTANSYSTYRGS